LRILFLSLFIVLADQISKIIVKGFRIQFLGINHEGMHLYESKNVLGEFFRITFIENPGMVFGIDFGGGPKLFLTLFSLAASVAIIYYIYKVRNQIFVLRLSLALIVGGAIGNLIDRMFYGVIYNEGAFLYGKVVDFFDIDFFDVMIFGHSFDRWPIFNIADLSVTIGVLLLLIFYNKISKSEEELKKQNKIQSEVTESDISNEVTSFENSEIKVGNNENNTSNDNLKTNGNYSNGEESKI
jgi:signal peptidase II